MNLGNVLTSSKRGWLGNRQLWVQLPAKGLVLGIIQSGRYTVRTKLGWFRAAPGQVRVTAQPVGGLTTTFRSDVGTVPEYGPTGFTPSVLYFGHAGCWRITGALAGKSLTFVLFVEAGIGAT